MQEDKKVDLIKAVIKKDVEAVLHCLKKGANPNGFEDRARIRPLHRAVVDQSMEIAHLLIIYGADPFLENEEGETPNDIALEYNDKAMVNLFRFSENKKIILH